MSDLKPGYYKLSRDVTNPCPDRRKTREVTAAPVWVAGTRFAVLMRDDHLELEFCDDRHPILTRRPEHSDMFKAIAPALEPVEMDLDLTLHKVGHTGYYILERLVRNGGVSLAQVEAAARELDEVGAIMSDSEDLKDEHRDEALNGLIEAIENTGGLITTTILGLGDCLVPKGDTEREWIDLADAYLNACKAMGVQPLIDGKRAPKILKITVQLARALGEAVTDVENDNETELLHGLFEKLPEDVEVAVVDCDGVYLYDAHREV